MLVSSFRSIAIMAQLIVLLEQVSLIFLLLSTGSVARECGLSELDLEALTHDGYSVINNAKRKDNSMVKTAYDQFVSINDGCSILWEKSVKECASCYRDKTCRSRAGRVCKLIFPTEPPSCTDLMTNASKACLYYANDRSGPCSDLTSKACESHVKNSCIERALTACLTTTATSQSLAEPTCEQIQYDPIHYCIFYASLCEDNGHPVERAQCVIDKCSERFAVECPLSESMSEPTCLDIIMNTEYSCNFYNDPYYCINCTDLSRPAECKECVDKHCQSRVAEVCISDQQKLYPKLKNISAYTEHPPFLIVITEELAMRELLELGHVSDLLLEAESELVDLLIPNQLSDEFSQWKDGAAGVKFYFTKIIPNVRSEGCQIIGNIIHNKAEVTIEHTVKSVINFFKQVESIQKEYVTEPTCEYIRQDPVSACSYYTKHGDCWSCYFNPLQDCCGWKTSLHMLQSTQSAQHWLATATNNCYEVLSVEPAKVKRCAMVKVKVHLFGRDYTVIVYLKDDVIKLGVRIAEAVVEKARQIDVTTV